MVVMIFWRIRIEPYFQKSFWNEFFAFFKISMPNGCIIKILNGLLFYVDFMSFSFRIPKWFHHTNKQKHFSIWIFT